MEKRKKESLTKKKNWILGLTVVMILGVSLLGIGCIEEETDEESKGSDPHVWMSLRKTEQMIDHFVEEIGEIDQENFDDYEDNAEDYTSELRELDEKLENNIPEGETFMIYHPSMGYFADDYGLEQLAVEVEGEDPGPGQIQGMIDRAEEEDAEVIFVSPQFDDNAAQTIADEIDGRVENLNPLAENYLENMEDISKSFMDAFNGSSSSIDLLSSSEEEMTVAVTIPPQIEWVEEVGGDRIDTVVMVPPGQDPHTYEPTSSKMEELSEADVYFKLGSGIEFEERHMDDMEDQNPDMEIIDGSENIELRDFDTDTEHEHDHEYDLETFDIIDRDTEDSVAYVHDDHWHGSLPELHLDEYVSLGAYIEDEDRNEIELEDNYQLSVNYALDADERIVSFEQHNDHVHIYGEEEGSTEVVFQLIRDEDIVYETPHIDVYVGDHDHEDEIGEFEIIDRDTDEEVAYVDGDHWHDEPLEMHEGEHLSLGAYIEDDHGHEIELGDEYQLGVSLAEGADDIVTLEEHGDHVHIHGEKEGSTELVFELIHDDHIDYETPPLDVDIEA